MAQFYDFSCPDIKGENITMANYRGKVVLVVNVASKCGFTPQYKGLETLYQTHKDQGLVILGFPCNQFAGQEPGTPDEISSFCSLTYGVSFPLFSKIDVNGSDTHPLYAFLKQQAKGVLGTEAIKWNFTKFLIDKTGAVVDRYAPATTPEDLGPKIKELLA
jgi:glutathione peroxidase